MTLGELIDAVASITQSVAVQAVVVDHMLRTRAVTRAHRLSVGADVPAAGERRR